MPHFLNPNLVYFRSHNFDEVDVCNTSGLNTYKDTFTFSIYFLFMHLCCLSCRSKPRQETEVCTDCLGQFGFFGVFLGDRLLADTEEGLSQLQPRLHLAYNSQRKTCVVWVKGG